jgi:hypothetical protein
MQDFYKADNVGRRLNLYAVMESFAKTEHYMEQAQYYVTEKYIYKWYAVYMDVYDRTDYDAFVGRLAVEKCEMIQNCEKVHDVDPSIEHTQTIQLLYEDFTNEHIELQVEFLG